MGHLVEWIDDFARFRAIGDAWDRLAESAGSPFALHRWQVAWWEAFGDGLKLSALALWDGDRLVGALPLCEDGRALRWMSNSHTPAAVPLHDGPDALDALYSEALRRRRPLALHPFPAGAPTDALLAASQRAGRLTVADGTQVSPYVALEGGWDDYFDRMKRKWSSADRKARKMGRDHEARFSIVEPPGDLDRELEAGFEVEASGWKGRAGTAITSSVETERFYRSVARAYDAAGELALSSIELDGRRVAFDLCLLHGRRLYLLKTGFDEGFKSLSPGLVLRYLVVRRCFELGLETHELLGHEAEWKQRFQTGVRSYLDVRIETRTPAGALRFGYRRFGRPALRSAYRLARRADRR